jgi:hypothetical protein
MAPGVAFCDATPGGRGRACCGGGGGGGGWVVLEADADADELSSGELV